MNELAWGAQLRLGFPVPQLASGNDYKIFRRARGVMKVPSDEVVAFKRHAATMVRKTIQSMCRDNPDFAKIEFPIHGKETLLRLDLYFGFQPDQDGSYRRMKLSDQDNLRKTTQDAFQGVLYDNDRYITEGFTAVGMVPGGRNSDVIWLVLSRAGYRQAGELEALWAAPHFAVIPPWRPQDRGDVLLAPKPGLILPGPHN